MFQRVLFAASSLLLVLTDIASSAEPYNFKGIKLGITIDQFRRLPFPDAAGYNPYVKPTSRIHAVCTGETRGAQYMQVQVYGDLKKIGAVKCAFYDSATPYARPVILMMGDKRAASRYDFLFIAAPDGAMRLYEIVLPTTNLAMADVLEALTEKFGPPMDAKSGTVQNRMGASFPQKTYTWSNGVSSILVQGPFSKIDDMIVIYSHAGLAAHVDALRKAYKGSIKNKM